MGSLPDFVGWRKILDERKRKTTRKAMRPNKCLLTPASEQKASSAFAFLSIAWPRGHRVNVDRSRLPVPRRQARLLLCRQLSEAGPEPENAARDLSPTGSRAIS